MSWLKAAPVDAGMTDDPAQAYEHGPAGCVSTLEDGTILRVNATFCAWTGHAASALERQRCLQDLFTVPGRIYFDTHLRPLLAMQGSISEVAVDVVRGSGGTLPVILNATQLPAQGHVPSIVRYALFAAADRRRYEQQLLHARSESQRVARAKTELLAMLSHDIRTPLGAMVAAADILEHAPLGAPQREALHILQSSANSLMTLVNRILEHGRIEAGALAVQDEPFDLRTLVLDLSSALRLTARNKGVELEARVDPQLPAQLVGDSTKLAQIFGNLAGNALKFTERGKVEIMIDVLERTLKNVTFRATVRDMGIGIPEEALSRIFEEYSQAHEGIAKRYGGTGLGLAIVRMLVRVMGGELHVRSRLGEGSVFWFELTLPIATAAAGPGTPPG